jgi:hypothetical protein
MEEDMKKKGNLEEEKKEGKEKSKTSQETKVEMNS